MDDETTPNVVHIDSTVDGKWAAQAQRRQLERRADEAKSARLDAQFKLLELLPAAVSYAELVLTGKVEADPEKTKITLALIDRVLPKLSAVRVDAAQVAGVDDVATGSASQANHFLNILADISRACSDVEEEERLQRRREEVESHLQARLEARDSQPHIVPRPQRGEWDGDAIEGSVVDPED